MKYTITILALLALASCEKKKDKFNCDCSSNRGQIVYKYEAEYSKASDGVPYCELAQDSIAAVNPNSGVECFLYATE